MDVISSLLLIVVLLEDFPWSMFWNRDSFMFSGSIVSSGVLFCFVLLCSEMIVLEMLFVSYCCRERWFYITSIIGWHQISKLLRFLIEIIMQFWTQRFLFSTRRMMICRNRADIRLYDEPDVFVLIWSIIIGWFTGQLPEFFLTVLGADDLSWFQRRLYGIIIIGFLRTRTSVIRTAFWKSGGCSIQRRISIQKKGIDYLRSQQ